MPAHHFSASFQCSFALRCHQSTVEYLALAMLADSSYRHSSYFAFHVSVILSWQIPLNESFLVASFPLSLEPQKNTFQCACHQDLFITPLAVVKMATYLFGKKEGF